MSVVDWLVLILTIGIIVLYGIWKSKGLKNIDGYLLADKKLPWYQVGLSVMATQASAITFLSAPGQAYSDGLRFVQFYFGLPLAMIVICALFIPAFKKLNVFTAYEYLESRFDNKTRSLTAFLFLLQRGLSTGITIYAPSIILSTILNIDIRFTTLIMGSLVILYTVYGGTKAVSYTQMVQMSIIFLGLFFAGYMVIHLLPKDVGLFDALHIAGKLDRMNIIDTKFDWNNRYNIWSGIIGGFFLQLSYFGTDQSQVGRYLTGKSISESRLGLVMNGLIKIPMQFLILLIGTLVFAFYQYHTPPIFFNKYALRQVQESKYREPMNKLTEAYNNLSEQKHILVNQYVTSRHTESEASETKIVTEMRQVHQQMNGLKKEATELIKSTNENIDTNDTNYVFLTFVIDFLPIGLVGLLVAIIFLAAMGSTASGLNSLASTSIIDFYRRFININGSEKSYLIASKLATIIWGVFCVIVALYAGKLGNLIEAVNILGSLFYGTILGVFLVAFLLPFVKGTAVFFASVIAEVFVIGLWLSDTLAFLWLNVAGCILVLGWAVLIQLFISFKKNKIA